MDVLTLASVKGGGGKIHALRSHRRRGGAAG